MKLKLTLLAALSAVAFSSCEKDTSEEWGELPSGSSSAPASALTNANNCKNCNYYPTCSAASYHYMDTYFGSTGTTPQDYTLQYIKDTLMEGKTYQKISGAGQQNTYFNCTSGVSSSIVLNGTTNGGSTLPYVKITNLKANEGVGAVWSDVISNSGGQPSTYTYKIISKGVARTVSGRTYADVIHVHEQTTTDVPGFGVINSGNSDYYFAKGTGLIESTSYDDFTGNMILHHVLVSASIP